ncbi:SWIM zinc finger domain protein [Pedobacter cryoconitis]|uniref:SWIM zinc finger domain protein n=1 Tax=Pedobacter cryoconitis TaxID=188932 RepID=A0A127V9U3_9SPHI|nr:SWIM zinc finger family protein [Pedobacter cryoconitis]AMP98116.1 SWIM zinc finger domain protein [Pedobacter cryoconitis]
MMQDFEYHYKSSSTIAIKGADKSFMLAHCSEVEKDNNIPCFFYGNIINSFVASKCLSAMAKTVRAHFAITPDQRISLRDPIVSVGNEQLHFEAFSSCNSVYARIDVLKEGIDGEFIQSGCTNVDFNDATIRAFNSVVRNEKLLIAVGSKEMQVITENASTTEKKVSLPDRWIKGLGNVQVYLAQMNLIFKLDRIQAIQLFRGLPKTPVKVAYFLLKSGNTYSFSTLPKPGSVRIGGIHRMGLIENLLMFTDHVSFYQSQDQQSIAVILDFKDIRMLFLLSDGVYRGFSGEGKNLENLTTEVSDELISTINHQFKTNEIFQPTLISIANDLQFQTMDTLQASLSSIGLLGYDLHTNSYFYRKLPFKLSRLKSLNPRMQSAIKLINQGDVEILVQDQNSIKAQVKGSSGVIHTVLGKQDDFQCTCNWFTTHQNKRGLCKHILALKMKLDL